MKKIKYGLIACAAALVVGLGISAARAVPSARNEEYTAQIATNSLKVGLAENGALIENEGQLLTNTFQEPVKPGKNYAEVLSAHNLGEADEYVRVLITRRWVRVETQEDGTSIVTEIPQTELDPELIRLTLNEQDWIVTQSEDNPEQFILFGKQILKSGESRDFNALISVDPAIVSALTHQVQADGKVISSHDYDAGRVQLQLSAEVDAVQVNNAKDAILSAWGANVNIADDGTLSLAEAEGR